MAEDWEAYSCRRSRNPGAMLAISLNRIGHLAEIVRSNATQLRKARGKGKGVGVRVSLTIRVHVSVV